MGTFYGFLKHISGFLWGFPALFLLIFLGLYLSFSSKFYQLRNLKASISLALSPSSREKKGSVSAFSSVCTALSATIGTGNIAGVAGAIALGGAGAVFWMLLSSVFSMIIKFYEIYFSVHFRKKEGKSFVGGPMYYIKESLPKAFHPFSVIFAFSGLACALGSGNLTQVNTVITTINGSFNLESSFINYSIGIIMALTAGVVLLGGGKRIFAFCEKFVPLMLVLYIALCLGVIFHNIKNIPRVVFDIFYGAFSPKAVTGGTVGSVFISMKKGFSRGVFSNEAGMGTSPIAYSKCQSTTPESGGLLGIFEVFCDTVLICTLTAFTILSAKTVVFGTDNGALPVVNAFKGLYGSFSNFLFSAVVVFFGISSVIGWGLFGREFAEFLFGKNSKIPFIILFCAICFLGADLKIETVWLISEVLSAFMLIPNCISLIFLSLKFNPYPFCRPYDSSF